MKKIIISLFIILLFSIVLPVCNTIYAADGTYDVILFWGQSNMVGYDGIYEWERQEDTRMKEVGIKEFSKLTGIKEEILENTLTLNQTKVEQVKGTVYEYIYSNELNSDKKTRGSLKELNGNTVKVGQKLTYNKKTGLLEKYDSNKHSHYSIQKSYGTNMIPQFCNQYYKRTGRKVIVVMCANGGESISNFLPSNDADYGERNETKKQYIYEAIVEKYSEAIKYLENNGYKIGRKLYVVSQTQPAKNFISDSSKKTIKDQYEAVFLKVHNKLKEDLGITKGAIVLNGSTPETGTSNIYEKTKAVHDAQVKLIQRSDIILGSSFHWNNYVPRKEIYESDDYKTSKFIDSKGKKLSYQKALKIARYSLCYDFTKTEDENKNGNHFTAAALSQTGYEVANRFSKTSKIQVESKPNKLKYYVGENLNKEGLKIKVQFVSGATRNITSGFTCTPTKLDKVGTQEITVEFEEKTTKFEVEVLENTLSKIEIVSKPSKVTYYKGETLNTSGLKIKATYAKGNSEEKTSGFTCTPTSLNTVGTQEITVTYGGKSAKFSVEVKEIEQKLEMKLNERIGYEIKSDKQNMYLENIKEKTTIEELKRNIETNGEIKIYKGTKEITDNNAKVATGMLIKISKGTEKLELKVVVTGDLNGDGQLNDIDLLMLARYKVKLYNGLKEEYLRASDIVRNGMYADDMDLLKMTRILVGLDQF